MTPTSETKGFVVRRQYYTRCVLIGLLCGALVSAIHWEFGSILLAIAVTGPILVGLSLLALRGMIRQLGPDPLVSVRRMLPFDFPPEFPTVKQLLRRANALLCAGIACGVLVTAMITFAIVPWAAAHL